MIFRERAGNLRQRGGDLIRLGRQDQNGRGGGHFQIGRKSFCSGFGGKMFACGVKRVGGEKLVCLDELGAGKTFGERGGHLARAEKADFYWCCHVDFVTGGGAKRKRNSQLEIAGLAVMLLRLGKIMSTNRKSWDTFELMRTAAQEGDAQAQCYLGVCYQNGQGVEQNHQEAVKWFRRAAEQNDPVAQCYLGVCYWTGQGVPQEFGEAAKWLREAAEQADPAAQFNLGMLYETGQGVPQNYAEAVKWYRESAERGYPAAQFNLGVFYETGQVVPQDFTEAVKWYLAAAEQELADAQCNLGLCYQTGRGVELNSAAAVKWFIKAARQGNKTAQHNLGLHYASMEAAEAAALETAKSTPR